MATQDRYATPLDTRQLSTGQLVYRSLMPLAVPANPLADSQIVATDSIRMDVLANTVYNDASQWWRIAAANRHADGSLYLRIGSTIDIPQS